MSVVLAVGYALLVGAVLASLALPRVSATAAAVGTALIGAAGIATAADLAHASFGIGSWLGFGHAALLSDRLAGIFLTVTGVTGAAVSLALVERPRGRLVAGLHALILFAVCVVVCSTQAFVFLLAWETITLCLYLLGSADRERQGGLLAGYFAGGMSKLGGAALLAAFALLYAKTGSFDLHVWAQAAPRLGGTRDAAFVLFLIAFGTKLGTVPFQGPLPPLYAAAPGASAATISVAFNAAFYGLWRLVFETLGAPPLWWGEMVVGVGAVTALVGILYAVAQDDVRRFLGFSSIEHGGIALVGFGVALVGHAAHEPRLAAAGLLAATLHVLMHGLAKALAFLGVDRLDSAVGTDALGPLGGLARLLPRTATGFGLAVASLAALPPFGGLVSEWLTLMALMQAFRVPDTLAQLILALGGALVALTGGVALLAFAKLYGGVFLGRARSTLGTIRESAGVDAGFAALALGALALGPIAPWEIRWLGHGLGDLAGGRFVDQAVSFPLVLGPVYQGFSVLSPTWQAAGIAAFLVAAALLVRTLLRPSVRRAPVWASGSAAPIGSLQYTPDSYANPIRVVLAGLYGFRRTVDAGNEVSVARTRIVPAFEEYLYGPVAAGSLLLAARIRRFQSGRLGWYLLYVLAVLLAVLVLVPALDH